METHGTYRKVIIALGIGYLLFAALMIWRSSSVGSDGHRYFSLFDDAMISMRYADNLAHGHGLVWNATAPGERVEGFTNPLLVGVMAITITLFGKVGGVLAIQVVGLLLLAANIWFIIAITKRLLPNNEFADPALLFTVILSVTFYPLLYWAIMGMETGLLTTLVLWAILLVVRESTQQRTNWLLAIVLGLCYLTRPDSVLFIGIIVLFRLVKKVHNLRTLIPLLAEMSIIFCIAVSYQLFRQSYYQAILPNTYVLKATGMALELRIRNGFLFSVPFLQQFGALISLAIVTMVVIMGHRHPAVRDRLNQLVGATRSHLVLFFSLFTIYLVYQIVIGGDPWPPYWRFIVPYLLLFFIALMVSAATAASLLRSTRRQFVILFTALTLLELLYGGKAYVYDLLIDRRPYQSSANDYDINTAIALRELTKPEAVIAPFWAGSIPYYSDRYAIDPLGKMDPYIARLPADVSGAVGWGGMISVPGHNKYDLNYSFKTIQPDFIQYIGSTCSWGRQNLKRWCDQQYQRVSYKGVELLLKKNSPNVYWSKLQ